MSTIKSYFCLMTGARVDPLAIQRLLVVTGERAYTASKIGPHLVFKRSIASWIQQDRVLEIPMTSALVYHDAYEQVKTHLREGKLATLWAFLRLENESVWVPVDIRFQKLESNRVPFS